MNYRKAMPARRPGYVYGFKGYDPKALLRGQVKIVWIYIGQTRQTPEHRWHQHQYGSPNGEPGKIWWLLVTSSEIIQDGVLVSDDELDAGELTDIHKLRPLANIKGNMANHKRIPPWEMATLMRQIQARGGVKACVDWATGKTHASAGWTLNQPTGQITWYGKDAHRVGAKWLKQSTGSSSSLASESGDRPGSMWRSFVSSITGRVPA